MNRRFHRFILFFFHFNSYLKMYPTIIFQIKFFQVLQCQLWQVRIIVQNGSGASVERKNHSRRGTFDSVENRTVRKINPMFFHVFFEKIPIVMARTQRSQKFCRRAQLGQNCAVVARVSSSLPSVLLTSAKYSIFPRVSTARLLFSKYDEEPALLLPIGMMTFLG